jgi:hypothetical protein
VPESEPKADQSPHNRTVKPNELQVCTDPLLNLSDQRSGLQGFQIFPHSETNLMMVSLHEITRCTTHPLIESRSPLGIAQQF